MITTAVHCDLSRGSRSADHQALMAMYALAPGTRVILYVGDRYMVMSQIHHLREYIPTLHIEIHGSDQATRSWEDALLERGIWEPR